MSTDIIRTGAGHNDKILPIASVLYMSKVDSLFMPILHLLHLVHPRTVLKQS